MAEGGETTTSFENQTYDPRDDDDDNVPADNEFRSAFGFDETNPFIPNGASTPAPGGEQIQMETMQKEKSGLPPIEPSWLPENYQENSFGGRTTTEEIEERLKSLRRNTVTGILNTTDIPFLDNPLSEEDRVQEIKRARQFMKTKFANGDPNKLVIRFSSKKPMDLVVLGPKGGETKIFLDDGSGFRKEFLNKTFVKNALGKPSEEIIRQASSDIKKRQRELEKERRDYETFQKNTRDKDEEIQNLKQRLNKEKSKVDQLKENQGTEYKVEIKRKEQLINNLEKDLKNMIKERKELQKNMKSPKKRSTYFRRVFLKKKKKEMHWKKGSMTRKRLMLLKKKKAI